MEERILSVNSDGDLHFDNERLLSDYIDDEIRKMEKCSDGVVRRTCMLSLGELCERHGLDCDAVGCYRNILLSGIRKNAEPEVYRRAYEGLSRLSLSSNESAWELALQTLAELPA